MSPWRRILLNFWILESAEWLCIKFERCSTEMSFDFQAGSPRSHASLPSFCRRVGLSRVLDTKTDIAWSYIFYTQNYADLIFKQHEWHGRKKLFLGEATKPNHVHSGISCGYREMWFSVEDFFSYWTHIFEEQILCLDQKLVGSLSK